MNAMIPMYVYTTNFLHDRIEAVKEHQKNQERGASAIEYVGVIVLAAVIIGGIAWAIRQFNIGDTVQKALKAIFQPNTGKNTG